MTSFSIPSCVENLSGTGKCIENASLSIHQPIRSRLAGSKECPGVCEWRHKATRAEQFNLLICIDRNDAVTIRIDESQCIRMDEQRLRFG